MKDKTERNIVLDITLEDPDTKVKRTVSIPENTNPGDLHEIIQKIMGWDNRHMYFFSAGNSIEITADPEGIISGKRILKSGDITVGELTDNFDEFSYYYDMCCFRTLNIVKTGEEAYREYPEVKAYEGENLPEETGSYSETLELIGNGFPDESLKFDLETVNSELKDK